MLKKEGGWSISVASLGLNILNYFQLCFVVVSQAYLTREPGSQAPEEDINANIYITQSLLLQNSNMLETINTIATIY